VTGGERITLGASKGRIRLGFDDVTLVPIRGDGAAATPAGVIGPVVARSGTPPPAAVIFDLGGVLIDWDPRYLYRTLFADEAAMERFLAEVTTPSGMRPGCRTTGTEAVEVLAARFPDQRPLIEAYHLRWSETLGGPIDGTVDIPGRPPRARCPAAGAEQLVGRDVPGRSRAIPVPRLVRGHRRPPGRSGSPNPMRGSSRRSSDATTSSRRKPSSSTTA